MKFGTVLGARVGGILAERAGGGGIRLPEQQRNVANSAEKHLLFY